MKTNIKLFLARAWKILSYNLGWKVTSVVFAFILWSFVISSDTTTTRIVSVAGVGVTVSGQSVLESRGMALLTDPAPLLTDVHVRVEVAQSNFSRVTPDTVAVELNLSKIRQTGTQQVPLSFSSTYGKVVQVTPASVEVTVETLDQRYVPVNYEFTGTARSDYWYGVSRINPSQITVSGPSSVVREVASALVKPDLTGVDSSHSRAEQFVLLNAQGEEITQSLTRSTSSITVGVDVYPKVQLPVDLDIDTTTTGTPAEGYRVKSVVVEPNRVSVAGEKELLEGLTKLTLTPVSVAGATKSFSTVTAINGVKDLKYISSAQVNVTVEMEEIEVVERFRDVPLTLVGKEDGLTYKMSSAGVEVRATGLYSAMEALTKSDITLTADVTGLGAGVYELPITATVDNHPEFIFQLEPTDIRVEISE